MDADLALNITTYVFEELDGYLVDIKKGFEYLADDERCFIETMFVSMKEHFISEDTTSRIEIILSLLRDNA